MENRTRSSSLSSRKQRKRKRWKLLVRIKMYTNDQHPRDLNQKAIQMYMLTAEEQNKVFVCSVAQFQFCIFVEVGSRIEVFRSNGPFPSEFVAMPILYSHMAHHRRTWGLYIMCRHREPSHNSRFPVPSDLTKGYYSLIWERNGNLPRIDVRSSKIFCFVLALGTHDINENHYT